MALTQRVSRYGWRADRPDGRDRLYNLEENIKQGHQLPAHVDLEPEMPPVYDQGQIGSCTANATAALLEHQQMRQGLQAVTPSRLFIYYEERRIEGQPPDQDTGAEIRDGIKVLVSEGCPPESVWPYSDQNPGPFSQKPPADAYQQAIKHEATVYKRIVPGTPGAPMRTALANHQPIAFGFSVPDYFEDPSQWDPATQALPLPGPYTQFIGGHAVVIVGYDYTRSLFRNPAFKVRNSWSAGWGQNGYFWVDARWFDPFRNLSSDFWTVNHVNG